MNDPKVMTKYLTCLHSSVRDHNLFQRMVLGHVVSSARVGPGWHNCLQCHSTTRLSSAVGTHILLQCVSGSCFALPQVCAKKCLHGLVKCEFKDMSPMSKLLMIFQWSTTLNELLMVGSQNLGNQMELFKPDLVPSWTIWMMVSPLGTAKNNVKDVSFPVLTCSNTALSEACPWSWQAPLDPWVRFAGKSRILVSGRTKWGDHPKWFCGVRETTSSEQGETCLATPTKSC